MRNRSKTPWMQINDFLVEVGSARNIDEFIQLTLANVGRILPFDANAMFVTVNTARKMISWKAVLDYEKWFALFNEYYWQTMPDVKDRNTIVENWNHHAQSEYANDFLKPQDIRSSLGIFCFRDTTHNSAAFTLHRSGSSRPFNENEEAICRIIQPHLANLYGLLQSKASERSTPDPKVLGEAHQSLTQREAEIAVLLCRGLDTQMIAATLIISPRTVQKHIQNIFSKMQISSRTELIAMLLRTKEMDEDSRHNLI